MKLAVFLKDSEGMFLYKVFDDDGKAFKSYTSFKSQGFDCVLINTLDTEDVERIRRLLAKA